MYTILNNNIFSIIAIIRVIVNIVTVNIVVGTTVNIPFINIISNIISSLIGIYT